jgi:hydroxymethylglutaryl-CoA lyase
VQSLQGNKPNSPDPELGGRVELRDCGPRDGLQGERPVAASARAALANGLARAGLCEVEAASFVSPRAVPAMADAADVMAQLDRCDTRWWALVPNERGAQLATDAGATRLTVAVAASEVYSRKNVGMTVEESLAQVEAIRRCAPTSVIDAVVSCAFGSVSADEPLAASGVAELVERLRGLGMDRITLADTTGTASPRRIGALLALTGVDVSMHLHNTRGTGVVNAFEAYRLGVRRFDTSIGGLGGSPFAPGVGGNVSTEELVLLFEDMGIDTGVDWPLLCEAATFMCELIGRRLPSNATSAGLLSPYS